MRDQQRLPGSPQGRREELFTQRYAQLRAWALRLTNQDRESAEDLVQDAFIQFALGRTSLEEIDNIDGYLRRMLRYMHLSRINRSAQKFFDQALSFSEYDSFRQTWRAIAPPDRMQAQEELCQICAYACSRKETSRAGSVLILRFFHDYYPTEIAKVLCTSRHCVDQWQRLARSELKLYLTGPTRLRFVNANSRAQTKTALTKLSAATCDVLGELRQVILRSRQGECLPLEDLHAIYEEGNADALTTPKLGHLVSCPVCLESVNQILGLPRLAERWQAETYDPPKTPPADGSGGNSSGGGVSNLQTNYKRRLSEVREHKPQELRIAVNGSVFGSLKVSSDRSELDLNLNRQQVDFIEVYSEQYVQLMFLAVSEEARHKSEQWAWIELSEGRSLEARLSFTSGPTLHLTYLERISDVAPAPTLLHVVKKAASESAEGTQQSSGIVSGSPFRAALRVLLMWIRAILPDRREATKNFDLSQQGVLLIRAAALPRKPLWTRPGFLTAVVSMLMIASVLFFGTRSSPPITAMNLLVQASVAEAISDHEAGQVTRRTITLEERRSAQGAVVARQRIEIWQRSGRIARARRVYDQRNRLIAATWNEQNGSLTVYHHGSKPQTLPVLERPYLVLMKLEDIWQLELSAKDFQTLITNSEEVRVEERSTSYILRYDKETKIGASRVLKAMLVLSRPDLHAIEQTLVIERGGEIREYRFVETSFEQLPQTAVDPSVFQIERELVDDKSAAKGLKPNTAAALPSVANTAPVASTELEVDVAYLLNQANGKRNEQITLSRTPNGLLRVEGIVDSEQRRLELLRAFAPVSNNPAVKVEIRSVAETMRVKAPASPAIITVREAEETENTIAVYHELRAFFAKPHERSVETEQRADELDELVRSFSSRIVNRGYRVLFHAIELRRLANRFAKVDMRTVSSDARLKWLQMTREHAMAIARDSADLRVELQPIFFADQVRDSTDEFELTNDAELWRAIERLHKLALSNNEAIREAFTISSLTSGTAIKSPQFWRSLLTTEKLATVITQYEHP